MADDPIAWRLHFASVMEAASARAIVLHARCAEAVELRRMLVVHVAETWERIDRLEHVLVIAGLEFLRRSPLPPRTPDPADGVRAADGVRDDEAIVSAQLHAARREVEVYLELRRLAAAELNGAARALIDESLEQERRRWGELEALLADSRLHRLGQRGDGDDDHVMELPVDRVDRLTSAVEGAHRR